MPPKTCCDEEAIVTLNEPNDHAADADSIAAIMESSAALLLQLSPCCEESFLEIGSALMRTGDDAALIKNTTTDIVSCSSSEQGNVTHMVSNLELFCNSVAQQVNAWRSCLARAAAGLTDLEVAEKESGAVVKRLRMLAISTKIESSRLGSLGENFMTLAVEVGRLAEDLSQKAASAHEARTSVTSDLTADTRELATTERLLAHFRSLSGTEATHAVELLQGEKIALEQRAMLQGEVCDQVVRGVQNLMVDLQYHDICRQRFEHAASSLQQEAALRDHERMLHACGLESLQAGHAAQELIAVVRQISERVGLLSDSFRDMAQLSGVDEFNGITTGVAQCVESLAHSLQQLSAQVRHLAERSSGLTRALQQLGAIVAATDEAATEIELLALNAQIGAAHVGNDGAALAVLAEEIQHLSELARSRSGATRRQLSAIEDATQELASIVNAVEQEIGAAERVLLVELSGLTRSLEADTRSVAGKVAAVLAQGEELSHDLAQLAARIIQLEPLIGEVATVSGRLAELAPEQGSSLLVQRNENYTMESERALYSRWAGINHEGAAIEDNFELF